MSLKFGMNLKYHWGGIPVFQLTVESNHVISFVVIFTSHIKLRVIMHQLNVLSIRDEFTFHYPDNFIVELFFLNHFFLKFFQLFFKKIINLVLFDWLFILVLRLIKVIVVVKVKFGSHLKDTRFVVQWNGYFAFLEWLKLFGLSYVDIFLNETCCGDVSFSNFLSQIKSVLKNN